MKISPSIKRNALIGVTSLSLAYVRHGLETRWGAWESWTQAGEYWLTHFFALGLFYLIAGPILMTQSRKFLDFPGKDPTADEVLVYLTLAVLIAVVAIFLLAHWIPIGSDDYSE